MRLPGQRVNMSLGLQRLLNQAEAECKKKIRFSGITREGFIGRTEWDDNEVLVEVEQTLNATIAEYIAAHELGHVLQLCRRCAIASGRLDEPGAVTIATMVTDFVLDPLTDSIAIGFGIPVAAGFQTWLESESLLDVLKRPRDGRRYGTNWKKVWKTLTEVRVCRALGLKAPNPPKDFWTLYIALDLGKIQQRATNLGLNVGAEILESIKKIPLLLKVVSDLVDIGAACSISESANKLVQILNYFKAEPGHIVINKPLTDEFLKKGQWEVRLSRNDATGIKHE